MPRIWRLRRTRVDRNDREGMSKQESRARTGHASNGAARKQEPRIIKSSRWKLSQWVTLVTAEVERVPGHAPEVYHSVALADYVTIVAHTPDVRIPIVKQFRPAIGRWTWELPAGTIEPGELPQAACRRELHEETGLQAEEVVDLGAHFVDTGRLTNRQHVFYVRTGPVRRLAAEPGMDVRLVTAQELRRLILTGEFTPQLHLAPFVLASLHGFDLLQLASS